MNRECQSKDGFALPLLPVTCTCVRRASLLNACFDDLRSSAVHQATVLSLGDACRLPISWAFGIISSIVLKLQVSVEDIHVYRSTSRTTV